MYFEIENTPEHIKKARRSECIQRETSKEECPRLILAPFNKPPQIVFDNVLIGTSCVRELEVYNPLKQVQQITLGRCLPPGIVLQLPGECLELEPETCYCISMMWTPMQPTAMRETIHFTNDNRRGFDVIVVLKSVVNIKGKTNQPKGLKVSPGKIKKKVSKKSPVAIYKNKAEIIYKTTKIKKIIDVQMTSQIKNLRVSNKENIATLHNYSVDSYPNKCPFDSVASSDFNFSTSEVFSNMKHPNLQDTYDKSYTANIPRPNNYQNVLKPSNKQIYDTSNTDLFDNLTFTPLKNLPAKAEKLEKGPKIILSLNSDSDLDDSLDMQNKESQTHSIISITSTQPNKYLTIHHETQLDSQCFETPTIQNKKHPDTSSPKDLNSPNFSINTEFSRISDLSFFPQRFSTERKCFPIHKINNDTHDIIDDIKISSDTFTKESPITPLESHFNQMTEHRPSHFFLREQNNKMCRQSLFKEQVQRENYDKFLTSCDPSTRYQIENYDKYCLQPNELNPWENYHKMDPRSPPRSITPPLQSIPEESYQFSDTQVIDKADRQTASFATDRTFDKPSARSSMSNNKLLWSKKAMRAEPDLWKIPIAHVKKSLKSRSSIKSKDSLCGNISNRTYDSNKSINQNVSFNQFGNVYSQALTVDPFMSTTYFYDEEAVDKFEKEFKRWLNYILTPPADLESNVEQKINVGKAWIENRNKEIPLAPTKEQVSSVYHNNHRLESLRRAARGVLKSSEILQVLEKLNAQIDKKLIAIRTDRNLHLDVGLQKIIMELLLSYNPLWLRIGLEAIYGLVIPLKSNSDIEGLTTFIIQRMFKNPHLKNKHSKSSAPNMLLPAYIDAIKKFTLKKFFMLVFFLDQAKQKKLISHDPCLFCRNAICKESREIIIRFTRELIAGIGDITKHLRPMGYVVCHKQSYLDEYKYAVHNIAVDIRDGVRLAKVMEIILIKNGLLNQLRTPAISRLQKIHNVQVALNALKEANFVIVGDITANDIADGHREKTLSLLWQIIHEFRAPLFEKASNVIQTWWRKKYTVIVQKRRQEEELLQKMNNAASVIQCWWRRIKYYRLVEWKMQQITTATIVLQKYWRMWLCRMQLRKLKSSVAVIENWYISVKLVRKAKVILHKLRLEREEVIQYSATLLQSYVRRWLCMKQYKIEVKNITIVQSTIRRYLAKSKYLRLKKNVVYIQLKFRSKKLMKQEMKKLAEYKKSAIAIQSYYRMIKQYRIFQNLRNAVKTVEERYISLLKMKKERGKYLELKQSVIVIQALYRRKKCRTEFLRYRNRVIYLQRKVRAKQSMERERKKYLQTKNSAIVLQKYIKSYLNMKTTRCYYQKLRESTILIQRLFRSYLLVKAHRKLYTDMRHAAIIFQRSYRKLVLMRKDRSEFLKIKNTAISIQRRYRAQLAMRKCYENYVILRKVTITIQQKFRAQIQMRQERTQYLKLKSSCVIIQNANRAYVKGKKQREVYLSMKTSIIKIQNWFRNCKKGKQIKQKYEQSKNACIIIQRIYRSYLFAKKQRQEYIKIRTATIRIQQYYRCYIEMKVVREQFIKLRSATIMIQQFYRSHLETKKIMDDYLRMKSAASFIAIYYRRYKEATKIKQRYIEIRKAAETIQIRFRSTLAMRIQRQRYLNIRQSVICIQNKYRALLTMRKERQLYLKLKSAVIIIQVRYRANILMRLERTRYASILKACISIQSYYRAYRIGKDVRIKYKNLTQAAIIIQTHYRLVRECRKTRNEFLKLRETTIFIQRCFRNNKLKRSVRQNEAATKIQRWYNSIRKRNQCRVRYLKIIKCFTIIQSTFRMIIVRKRYIEMKKAAVTIQQYYRSYKLTTMERYMYLRTRNSIIKFQSYVRAYIARKQYLRLRSAALTIQSAYRLKRFRDLINERRQNAAVCIQKNIRCYLERSRYTKYRNRAIFIQRIWRGNLLTRLMRCEFLQKKKIIIRFQAAIRGFLVRKQVQRQKENIIKLREQQKLSLAASIIQALFRGHRARLAIAHNKQVTEIRRRWRKGALNSDQETLKERNEEAMNVLRNMSDIEFIIRAFRSLELLTEVYPKMYHENASSIVHRIYVYMSVTNRSISSIEVLKSAAAVLVNLTRYRITGPKIYTRDRISPILKFMWRFSNSEIQLFCILTTYLWLFAKYDDVKEDLSAFLHIPDNHKMLMTIKGNIGRMKRMTSNAIKNKFHTPQPSRFISHTANLTVCSTSSGYLLPTLEPDYGIVRADKPRYFEDAQQAINCLFRTYNL